MPSRHRTIESVLTEQLPYYDSKPSGKKVPYLAANLLRHLGRKRIHRAHRDTVTFYRHLRFGESASAATINREVGLLRACLRRAGIHIEFPQALIEKAKSRVLTTAEAKWLVFGPEVPHHASELFRMLICTGARVGEVLGARVCDYDDVAGRLQINDPKEGEAKVLVLTSEARRVAQSLRWRNMRLGGTRAFGRSGYTAGQDYDWLRYHLRRFWKREGIEPVTLHDLRRTFASWAIRDGATLEQVGQTLGHKDPRTTRRYARLDEASRIAVTELVTRRLEA